METAMGGMSSGKGRSATSSSFGQTQPQQPQIQYVYPEADTSAAEAEKTKVAKALLARKGRQSTILTPDKLGDVAIDKRQLLGQ